MALVETLDQLRKRELALEWDRNEAQLATSLSTVLPEKRVLDDDTKDLFRPFMQWAAATKVRHLPARPCSVASFIFKQFDAGVKPDVILEQVAAIEALHDAYSCSNPVQTSPVRYALNQVADDVEPPPRSWPKAEKIQFLQLPPQIRNVIANREQDRETNLRRLQNECAELRKLTANSTAPELKPVETLEKVNQNG
jgi:hypothetical protein